jgi:hypothetical protein
MEMSSESDSGSASEIDSEYSKSESGNIDHDPDYTPNRNSSDSDCEKSGDESGRKRAKVISRVPTPSDDFKDFLPEIEQFLNYAKNRLRDEEKHIGVRNPPIQLLHDHLVAVVQGWGDDNKFFGEEFEKRGNCYRLEERGSCYSLTGLVFQRLFYSPTAASEYLISSRRRKREAESSKRNDTNILRGRGRFARAQRPEGSFIRYIDRQRVQASRWSLGGVQFDSFTPKFLRQFVFNGYPLHARSAH